MQELQAEEDEQIEAVTVATTPTDRKGSSKKLFAREQQLLDQMTEVADSARAEPDARVSKLIDWIRKHMCPNLGKPGAKWNDVRVLIFTEYDDTKRYLQQQLAGTIERSDCAEQRIAIYHGPTPPADREAIKKAFNADPKHHPVRILIATDAAREGLNLQAHCWNLFHFDVPWNPSRMEQRNGRIDRKLQDHTEVFCHYFVYHQRPEDRILKVLVQKTERIKKELGSLAQVIDARLADTLRTGIRRDRIESLEQEILAADLEGDQRKTVEEELESNRERQNDLRRQVDILRDLVEKSKESIGLDDEQFRQAISCSLQLLGADPLKIGNDKSGERTIPTFEFPALDQREAADPTWADTLDTLRAPRDRGQKLWEWRRASPIRPVVFEDSGKLDDEVVHLHLEHRVVQRLLARFIAQGFVHHDLSRACLAQTTDAIPRVILLGRLCLYGPGAARLHEEIVPVTARWTDPKIRKNPLSPYAREAETKTLQLLRDSLTRQAKRQIDKQVQQQLLTTAARDIKELLLHLQARGEEYAEDAKHKLQTRGQQEAKAMQNILETQKKHIGNTEAKHARDNEQGVLPFFENEDEQRQLEANKRYWAKRLTMIERELLTEPERIRDPLSGPGDTNRAGRPRVFVAGDGIIMARDPETMAHLEWLGYVQPVGLVVSIPALLAAQAHVGRISPPDHQRFLACLPKEQGRRDPSRNPRFRAVRSVRPGLGVNRLAGAACFARSRLARIPRNAPAQLRCS